MKVYQTDYDGFLVGEAVADPDPLIEGGWLIPGGCVEKKPPNLTLGQRAKFIGGAWAVVDPEPEAMSTSVIEAEVTRDWQEALRRSAYREEADPLFFMSQRGEATTAEWEAKVAEIKARYPYPEV